MASIKEIRSRMDSIRDTMKITNAMYMISSAKLKKAKKMLDDTEPYFVTLQSEMERILRHIPELKSPYFEQREVKTKGFIVVTADKGMAGAYNHNILKLTEEMMAQSDDSRLYVLGELGRHYFEQKKVNIDEQFHYTVQNPSLSRARNVAEKIIDDYLEHRVDEVWLIYTRMINSMTAEPRAIQLLPLKRSDFHFDIPLDVHIENLMMKPSPEAVMHKIVPNYVIGYIYGALVESFASEQNSRLLAMQAATDSASKMLGELDMIYNRARQAAITQEITEVIGGVKALKKKKK
ncbi:MAG TPA: ATP synthase F1 subunit gamma [Candidatus Fimousia stercorigallinarum]|nr:ATP synthase F1 subunit gamma [Candidatus Fimousia stercorigallinarum]